MSKGHRVTAHERIIKKVDAFASTLLDKVQADSTVGGAKTHTLDQQLQVFKEVAGWVKIKHGIIEKTNDDAATEGSMISELKAAIKGDAGRRAASAGSAKQPRKPPAAAAPAPRKPAAAVPRGSVVGGGGKGANGAAGGLAAIKSRLPRANAGNTVGDSDDAVGAVHPDDELHRELHAHVLSDTAGDADDAGSGS